MRKLLVLFALFALLGLTASAQQTAEAPAKPTSDSETQPLSDSDIQLIRSNVQAAKNDIIVHTMQFTDAESKAFWPIYRSYAHDQQAIADDRVSVIKDYAANYDSLDDAKAKDLFHRMIDIDSRNLKLREDYWPKFMKAVGGKKAAKFYQVDSRITLIINLQLSSGIPLIR
jgi:hypothetical protein